MPRLVLLSILIGSPTALAQPPTIHMQCGGFSAPYIATNGDVFEPDRPYGTGSRPFRGHIGGTYVDNPIPAAGTLDAPLYREQRFGAFEYRFDAIPPGTYGIELRFAEWLHHGPGQNVFDVWVEGSLVIEALDLWAIAGKDYAVDVRVRQEVHDGTLNVEIRPRPSSAAPSLRGCLAALSIRALDDDGAAPPFPNGLEARSDFGRTTLVWKHPPLPHRKGVSIYRADQEAGPYALLNESPTPLSRYIDEDVSPGTTYFYQVATVDLWDREGPPSPSVAATPYTIDESALDVLDLQVSASDLDRLRRHTFDKVFVPVEVSLEGVPFGDVTLGYRGKTSRRFHKKSLKLRFSSDQPFDGRTILNAQAMATEWSHLRDRLTLDLFAHHGIPTPRGRFLHVNLNDEYLGVFLDIEQVNSRFLSTVGLDPDGALFRSEGGDLSPEKDWSTYSRNYEIKAQDRGFEDLIYLVELLDSLSDEEFAVAARSLLDVEEILTYYATLILIGRHDFTDDDYYLHQDRVEGRWRLIPWDNDETWGKTSRPNGDIRADTPIDMGTEGSPEDGTNVLFTRLMEQAPFRDFHALSLAAWIHGKFSPPQMAPVIENLHRSIAFDVERDLHKWGRENNDAFINAQEEILDFISERGAFLLGEIPRFAPLQGPYLFLNEIVADNRTGARDEYGEVESWFELLSFDVFRKNLEGMFLTDDLQDPTKWEIPAGIVIEGGERLVFWADADPSQGDRHTSFALSEQGGTLALFDRDGTTLLHRVDYGPSAPDHAWQNLPDGSDQWSSTSDPTPGAFNFRMPVPPTIANVERDVQWPSSGDDVTVTCQVIDDQEVSSVTLFWSTGEDFSSVAMQDDGAHGDGLAGDSIYGATLPSQPDGTIVCYYIEARDDRSLSRREPPTTLESLFRYRVGDTLPLLRINEFMASNDATLSDEEGEFDDWIEIYNASSDDIELGGLSLTDDLNEPHKWAFPQGTVIPGGGHLLVWADDDLEQGPLHASFKLSKLGEQIGIFTSEQAGALPIDTLVYGPQETDVSRGRLGDGAPGFVSYRFPTPQGPNPTFHRHGLRDRR